MTYGPEVQEKAYELRMLEGLSDREVVRRMRETWPKFDYRLLRKWREDTALDWKGRHDEFLRIISVKNDAARVKAITPILSAIQEIREMMYLRLVSMLELKEGGESPFTTKNVGVVLKAFAQLCDLELRRVGGGPEKRAAVEEVIMVIFAVIERTPNVGPVFAAHRREIVDAVYEIIEEKKE